MPEDNGDPRLLEACWRMMDVKAKPPGWDMDDREFPVLDVQSNLDDLPRDHTEGTEDDPITLVAVVRLAKAALAAADVKP